MAKWDLIRDKEAVLYIIKQRVEKEKKETMSLHVNHFCEELLDLLERLK